MNRRSLFFIFGMTLIFFAIHQYFDTKKVEKLKQEQVANQQALEQQKDEKFYEIAKRTAKKDELPLVKLYADAKGHIFASWALVYQSQFITLSWEETLPDSVYYFPQGSPQTLHLMKHPETIYTPVVYTEKAGEIPSVHISEIPFADLQIISGLTNEEDPSIVLGEYENHSVYYPGHLPEGNALALYLMDGAYVPVGFYDYDEKRFQSIRELPDLEKIAYFKPLPSTSKGKEQFWVLENGYQQVVISSIGGAISEINLPFYSKENPKSAVRSIEIDQKIDQYSKANDYFPIKPYLIANKHGELIEGKPTLGGYYPLLRRGIESSSESQAFTPLPKYYAFNTVSNDPELARTPFILKKLTPTSIELEAILPSRRIIKTYQFPENPENAPYVLEASIRIEGDSRNLWITSGVPEVELISGNPAPFIKYRPSQNSQSKLEKLSLPKTETLLNSIEPDWVCNANGFFGLILDPLSPIASGLEAEKIPGSMDPTRLTLIDAKYNRYPADKYPGYSIQLPLKRVSKPTMFRIYAGPFDQTILQKVDETYSIPIKNYTPNYLSVVSIQGWLSFITQPFAKFIFFIMKMFYQITHSWGFSIILATLVLRILLYPLNAWSIKSTVRMSQISPKIQKIQAKYKKDPKKAQLEIMQLYKQEGVNPFTGCLPLLIQMPFLIGMFNLLKSTFELRGVPFIPGWINNLTAPDVLFSWSYPIPFFGTEFHLLPFILGAAMYFQQKFSSMQNKGATLTDQQKQSKKMGNIMTVVFTVLFYHFPSGLNLYWLSSMVLAILQQWLTAKRLKQGKSSSKEIKVERSKN